MAKIWAKRYIRLTETNFGIHGDSDFVEFVNYRTDFLASFFLERPITLPLVVSKTENFSTVLYFPPHFYTSLIPPFFYTFAQIYIIYSLILIIHSTSADQPQSVFRYPPTPEHRVPHRAVPRGGSPIFRYEFRDFFLPTRRLPHIQIFRKQTFR